MSAELREPLTSAQRHMLHLAARDADKNGWASVSKTVWPHIDVPEDLLEREAIGDRGRVRVTSAGLSVLRYGGPTE